MAEHDFDFDSSLRENKPFDYTSLGKAVEKMLRRLSQEEVDAMLARPSSQHYIIPSFDKPGVGKDVPSLTGEPFLPQEGRNWNYFSFQEAARPENFTLEDTLLAGVVFDTQQNKPDSQPPFTPIFDFDSNYTCGEAPLREVRESAAYRHARALIGSGATSTLEPVTRQLEALDAVREELVFYHDDLGLDQFARTTLTQRRFAYHQALLDQERGRADYAGLIESCLKPYTIDSKMITPVDNKDHFFCSVIPGRSNDELARTTPSYRRALAVLGVAVSSDAVDQDVAPNYAALEKCVAACDAVLGPEGFGGEIKDLLASFAMRAVRELRATYQLALDDTRKRYGAKEE